MARVFVATDRRLGRRVVIKVLSPELAADVSTRRFQREIRLAASLQHPNIVPLLSAGDAEQLPHYTMPFVEGLSLRYRLAHRLELSEAVRILRDVALAYAHEHGVVHRDIKPRNVLLTGDAAVVTDFGIAKAIAPARAETQETTRSGITLAGTARVTRLARRLTRVQRRTAVALLLAAVAAAAVLAVRRLTSSGTPSNTTIAVVPFLSAAADPSDYLAEGIADGLATTLGRLPGVRMVSRSAMYHFRGRRDLDARAIGDEVGADRVVRFTVRQSGEALQVSAQLLNARNNREEWSDIYNRRASDAFAVQDDLARQIAVALEAAQRAHDFSQSRIHRDATMPLNGRQVLLAAPTLFVAVGCSRVPASTRPMTERTRAFIGRHLRAAPRQRVDQQPARADAALSSSLNLRATGS